ncbi:MAG: hypothetical protein NVSMB67_12310 [Flavisolibacter sp.]
MQLEIVQLKEQLKKFEVLQLQTTGLQQQLSQLQKMIFGSKHERFIPTDASASQLSLEIQADSNASCSVLEAKRISYIRTSVSVEEKPLVHPGRMKLPEHLRREEITIEPTEDNSGCKKMGEEITEVLEWAPGELYVKKYVRLKYARPGLCRIARGSTEKCHALLFTGNLQNEWDRTL